LAPGNVDRVNAPTLIGATGVAGHPPTKPTDCLNRWYIHHGRDEALRVAAPSLTTSNRAAAISTDGAVIAADHEASASSKNILKSISTVTAELQHTAIVAEVRILARRFKVEVVPEGQTWGSPLEKTEL
jgi:hypothetical protein